MLYVLRLYPSNMNLIVKALPAKKPRTLESQKVSYMFAVILIIFLLSQLYSFDEFLLLVESFWIPGGYVSSQLLASIIVTTELFALPFLLGMSLSPLMRICSMVCCWLAPTIWLLLSIWLNVTTNAVSNIGFLGTTVSLIPGWWTMFFSFALVMLSIWASWGLWPFPISKGHLSKQKAEK